MIEDIEVTEKVRKILHRCKYCGLAGIKPRKRLSPPRRNSTVRRATPVCYWPRHLVSSVIGCSTGRRWCRPSVAGEGTTSERREVVSDPIVEFVLHEPRERVERLADALERNRITLSATASQLDFAFVHGPKSRQRMLAVISSWREAGGGEALLARVLRGQLEIRRGVEELGPLVELVWTGETPGGAGVRATLPVVAEMLSRARRSVMVVTYSLWIGGGDAGDVVDRLAELSSSGVDVTFVLDARYGGGRICRSSGRAGRNIGDGRRCTAGRTRMTRWPSCTPRW